VVKGVPKTAPKGVLFCCLFIGTETYAGNPAATGLNSGLLKAVWTLVIAFSLNWMYGVGDGSMDATRPHTTIGRDLIYLLYAPTARGVIVGGRTRLCS
jgi:hypothetical protein